MLLLLFFYYPLHKQIYLFLAFQVTKRVAYLFFYRFSKPESSQKNPGYLRPSLNTLYQVTPRATVGPALYLIYTQKSHPTRYFVVHSDMGRSRLRNAQPLERLSGKTGLNVAPKWRAERASALGDQQQFCRGWVFSRMCWASACTAWFPLRLLCSF